MDILLPIDGTEHVLSYQQIDYVRQGLSSVIPHHYFVWSITHRASCLLPPNAWMKNPAECKFTEKGEITLQFEEVKVKDLALCFGNKVAFVPEEELEKRRKELERKTNRITK